MGFYAEWVFPLILDVTTRGLRDERAEVLAEAHGDVLELGVGTGSNLAFYPPTARWIVGIEPSLGMLRKARTTVRSLAETSSPRAVSLLRAGAERLPFANDSFDTLVACLVFCSIGDPGGAADEMVRVLRPGGRLVFFEHVRSPDARLAAWQRRLTPLWRRLGCGCELDRDTQAVFEGAGFQLDPDVGLYHPKMMKLAGYVIRGTGIKP